MPKAITHLCGQNLHHAHSRLVSPDLIVDLRHCLLSNHKGLLERAVQQMALIEQGLVTEARDVKRGISRDIAILDQE